MFNEAYAVGGPACTIKTVEEITDIRVNHFVVVDFNGFKNMVDALDGVPVCVPEEVNDDIGKIYLPEGSYEVKGQEALSYVRLRHGLSENGDIGRMKRQQAFLAAMSNKAISAGTLVNPVRLYNFLDAATESLTTDPGLASLSKLGRLAKQVRDIGLENVQFLTVPFETYEPDPNRLAIAPAADRLWDRLREDEPLSARQEREVTTAAESPAPGSGAPSEEAGGAAEVPRDAVEAARERAAAENGLCA
jgi:LCP family protein required for cell wall assembly